MLVFILRGSLIASFFPPFLCYPWAICCPITAIWMESIKLTLLRTYDPWPNRINSSKMIANIVRLHQFSAVSNNITDKWTSSTFMFSESQVTVLEVQRRWSGFYFTDELRSQTGENVYGVSTLNVPVWAIVRIMSLWITDPSEKQHMVESM